MCKCLFYALFFYFCRLLYDEMVGEKFLYEVQDLKHENDQLKTDNCQLQSKIHLLERKLRSA